MILSYYLLLFILFFPSITCKVLRYYFKTCFKIMIVFVKKKMFAIKKNISLIKQSRDALIKK